MLHFCHCWITQLKNYSWRNLCQTIFHLWLIFSCLLKESLLTAVLWMPYFDNQSSSQIINQKDDANHGREFEFYVKGWKYCTRASPKCFRVYKPLTLDEYCHLGLSTKPNDETVCNGTSSHTFLIVVNQAWIWKIKDVLITSCLKYGHDILLLSKRIPQDLYWGIGVFLAVLIDLFEEPQTDHRSRPFQMYLRYRSKLLQGKSERTSPSLGCNR